MSTIKKTISNPISHLIQISDVHVASLSRECVQVWEQEWESETKYPTFKCIKKFKCGSKYGSCFSRYSDSQILIGEMNGGICLWDFKNEKKDIIRQPTKNKNFFNKLKHDGSVVSLLCLDKNQVGYLLSSGVVEVFDIDKSEVVKSFSNFGNKVVQLQLLETATAQSLICVTESGFYLRNIDGRLKHDDNKFYELSFENLLHESIDSIYFMNDELFVSSRGWSTISSRWERYFSKYKLDIEKETMNTLFISIAEKPTGFYLDKGKILPLPHNRFLLFMPYETLIIEIDIKTKHLKSYKLARLPNTMRVSKPASAVLLTGGQIVLSPTGYNLLVITPTPVTEMDLTDCQEDKKLNHEFKWS